MSWQVQIRQSKFNGRWIIIILTLIMTLYINFGIVMRFKNEPDSGTPILQTKIENIKSNGKYKSMSVIF